MAQKNIIGLTVTSTTSGAFFEITIPNGIGGYESKRISFAVLSEAVNLINQNNKGWAVDEADIIAKYPVGEVGWFIVNADTDTVWIWDGDTSAWVDTTSGGVVASVNGLTGTVVLEADDIAFASASGLSATNVRDGIDELKLYIDSTIAGAGGPYVTQQRADSAVAIVPGDNVITFSDPFLTANYSLQISESNDLGLDIEGIVKTVNGFTVNATGTGTIDYTATQDSVTGSSPGIGDMLASVYDPTTVAGDAFDMDNMVEGTTNKILTAAERTILSNTSGTNTGDQDLSAYQLKPAEGAFVDGDKTKLDGIETGAEVNNISDANATALTGGGATALHYHNDIDITPASVSVVAGTPDTVTLDCDSKRQKVFTTDTISNNLTLQLSNNTNIQIISYHFRITGTVVMTFGSSLNWVSDDTDWDDTGDTYTFTGSTNSMFEISIVKVTHGGTDYYKVKFTGEQL